MPDYTGTHLKIHYVEQGEGAPVVFVHGLVMDHTMFAAQFEDLPDSYRCIALDLRGHGRSECPPGPWTMQDSVNDVTEFIRGVEAAPCHLVGMSWGGYIASRITLQDPELVRSLVMIDSSFDADSDDMAALERGYMDAVAKDGLTDEIIEASLPLLYGERFRTEEQDAVAVHFDRLHDMKREGVVEALRAIVVRDSLLSRAGDVKVPVLIIHGEEDLAIPIAQAEKMAELIPNAELVRVPGAGHSTPLEAPDVVNEALAAFLARVA